MKNVLILAANGQISRIVEQRVLSEQGDVHFTLFLRNKERLNSLANNPRVTLVEGDLNNADDVNKSMHGQDMAIVAVVDHSDDSKITHNVINAAKANDVKRIVQTNLGGIYDEFASKDFEKWAKNMMGNAFSICRRSADALEESGLDYTILRLPWLNDRGVHYVIGHKGEPFIGTSGSRASVADVIVKIIADPNFAKNDSISISDPDTQDATRPVY